jgi:hypothetical protein
MMAGGLLRPRKRQQKRSPDFGDDTHKISSDRQTAGGENNQPFSSSEQGIENI